MLEGKFKGREVSLFLDFDGTLAPIVARPELAALSYFMKQLLRSLPAYYPVIVITGRGMKDIKDRVGMKGIVYAANHGMEIWSENFTMLYDLGDAKKEIRKIENLLKEQFGKYKGIVYENKGATTSVHYRLLDSREKKDFLPKVKEFLRAFENDGLVKITDGKKVVEIRPPISWNKGSAVDWILDRAPFNGTVPVYVGDDQTDFDGFRAVKDVGVSVYVGSTSVEKAGADFYLKSQLEVNEFLQWLKDYGKRKRLS